MEIYLQFIILGIGAGVIFSGLALGLVMTHRASGVVNFAHGAIAAYSVYVFSGLANELIRGEDREAPEWMFWEHAGHSAVRNGDFKALRPKGQDRWEL